MNPIPAAGLLIGVLCGLWMFVMGFTGWYKDPAMLNAFFMVIVIEITGLIWGLKRTAAQGRTYSGQVVAGTLMAITAGAIIICFSLLFTTVAFPDYFTEVNEISRKMMLAEGKSEPEIAEAIRIAAPMQTPLNYAMSGFFGTFVTGVVAASIIGIWVRRPA
jgi:hypothetical protein